VLLTSVTVSSGGRDEIACYQLSLSLLSAPSLTSQLLRVVWLNPPSAVCSASVSLLLQYEVRAFQKRLLSEFSSNAVLKGMRSEEPSSRESWRPDCQQAVPEGPDNLLGRLLSTPCTLELADLMRACGHPPFFSCFLHSTLADPRRKQQPIIAFFHDATLRESS